MKIYASNKQGTELAKFAGKDIWVKVLYQGFYHSNYEYIKVAQIDDDHILYNSLNIYSVHALVSAQLSLMKGEPLDADVYVDSIRHELTAPPRSTLSYLFSLCTPIDAYTTEELLAACDDLEAAT